MHDMEVFEKRRGRKGREKQERNRVKKNEHKVGRTTMDRKDMPTVPINQNDITWSMQQPRAKTTQCCTPQYKEPQDRAAVQLRLWGSRADGEKVVKTKSKGSSS